MGGVAVIRGLLATFRNAGAVFACLIASLMMTVGNAFALSVTGDPRLPSGNLTPITYDYDEGDPFGFEPPTCSIRFGSIGSGSFADVDRWGNYDSGQINLYYRYPTGNFLIVFYKSGDGQKLESGDFTVDVIQNPSGDAPSQLTVSLTDADLLAGPPDFIEHCTDLEPDITPPLINHPGPIMTGTDQDSDTAIVNFTVTANDDVDGAVIPTITSTPAGFVSGSAFPVGTTTINVEAVDSSGNMAFDSFDITVTDDEAPSIDVPGPINVNADPGSDSATVTFDVSVTDNVDDDIVPTIDFPSGSSFPIGTTTVTAEATDSAGNFASASFEVTVNDAEAPVIQPPDDIRVSTDPGKNTAVVTFSAPQITDNVDGPLTPDSIVSSPTAGLGSGSAFPIGTTTMTITATDSNGNVSKAKFTITVENDGPSFGKIPAISVVENQTDVIDLDAIDDSDSEGTGLVYSFSTTQGGGVDNGFFTLNASTGVLAFAAPPDFENPQDNDGDNTYEVQVTVTDSGGLSENIDLSVTVTDEDEGPTAEETQQIVSEFISNRANNILGNQPNLNIGGNGFGGGGGGPLGYLAINGDDTGQTLFFSTSRSRIKRAEAKAIQSRLNDAFGEPEGISGDREMPSDPAYAFSSQGLQNTAEALALDHDQEGTYPSADIGSRMGTWDLWVEIYGSRSENGTSDASLVIGYLGAHYFIDDYTAIGILGQLDWSDETNSAVNSSADGFGWMVGPYISGIVPGHNLYYEARVAYGTSDNTISPIGTYTDSFDTTRWIATGKVSGNFTYGMYNVSPSVSVAWYEETQEAYIDSLATPIPETTVSIGEVRFGPSISKDVVLNDGTVFKPTLGVSGVFNFGINNNNAAQATALGDNDLRARVDAGFTANGTSGLILMISGFYDGIGINGYHAYGGSARITIPLN